MSMDSYVLLLLILLMLLWVRENTATGVAALVARAHRRVRACTLQGEGHQGSVQRGCYRLARMTVAKL